VEPKTLEAINKHIASLFDQRNELLRQYTYAAEFNIHTLEEISKRITAVNAKVEALVRLKQELGRPTND
jgi:hypothetical protein